MNAPVRRPTNDTTELAKERNREAAERTISSWIVSSLLLIGLGISIEEIYTAMNQVFPQNNLATNLQLTNLMSLGAIACGIILLIPITITHRMEIKALEEEHYLTRPVSFLNLLLIVGSVMLFGLITLVAVVLILSRK